MVGGIGWFKRAPQVLKPFQVALMGYRTTAPNELRQGQHRHCPHRDQNCFGPAGQVCGEGEISPLRGDGRLRELRGGRLSWLARLQGKPCRLARC
jgi:hypothetical protein